VTRTGALAFVAAIGLLVAGCRAAALSPLPSVDAVATVEALAPAGLAKLDPPSRALVEELNPNEWARAELSTGADAQVRLVAVHAGLQLTPAFPGGPVGVLGPVRSILSVASDEAIAGVVLHEDERALRVISPALPANTVMPVPAQPYAARHLVVPPEQRGGDIPAGRRAALMAVLEKEITTIDGAPYANLQSDESCEPEPPTCRLLLIGQRENANLLAQADNWEARLLVAPTGVETTVIDMGANSLPRWVAREAERIARSDPAAAAAISGYTTVSTFRWASGGNLVIFVEYARTGPCRATGRPRPGDCTDTLTVAVDPAAAAVLDIDEVLSP
jgi:hypothetical protein